MNLTKSKLEQLIREEIKFVHEASIKRSGDPTYAQKIYNFHCRVGIDKKKGGDREETFTEIRGIPGVTIVAVDSRGTSRDENWYYSTITIKFELIQGESVSFYRQSILLPGLRKIKGLRIIKMGKVSEVS